MTKTTTQDDDGATAVVDLPEAEFPEAVEPMEALAADVHARYLAWRERRVLAALARFSGVYEAWLADDDLEWGNVQWQPAIDLVLEFASGMLSKPLMRLLKPIENLATGICWAAFVQPDDEDSPIRKDWTDRKPGPTFHNAAAAIQKALIESAKAQVAFDPRDQAAMIPSISELLKSGCTLEAAARTHGLSEVDAAREYAVPGSVCGNGYIPPRLLREREEQELDALGSWPDGIGLAVSVAKIRALQDWVAN